MIKVMTIEDAIRESWSKETTQGPWGWTEDNPSYGQCVVSSLVFHDYTGADIVHGDVIFTEAGTERSCQHFWNILEDEPVDLTWDQFPEEAILIRDFGYIHPGEILSFDIVREPYEILKERVDSLMETRV